MPKLEFYIELASHFSESQLGTTQPAIDITGLVADVQKLVKKGAYTLRILRKYDSPFIEKLMSLVLTASSAFRLRNLHKLGLAAVGKGKAYMLKIIARDTTCEYGVDRVSDILKLIALADDALLHAARRAEQLLNIGQDADVTDSEQYPASWLTTVTGGASEPTNTKRLSPDITNDLTSLVSMMNDIDKEKQHVPVLSLIVDAVGKFDID